MFALVESGSITKTLNGNKGIKIGDIKHPATIYSLWTEAERNAIGVYTVEIDETNRKDEQYYINTDITYAFGSGKVTGSYGTATAKSLDDVLFTQADEDAGLGTKDALNYRGLKYIEKQRLDGQCASILAPSDWMYVKAGEEGVSMDSGWKTWRASVRTKCNSMQTQIDNAADMDAFIALFTYTEQEDKSVTRPLGEFPKKE
tara:strand:+ start:72 stop:677 length:606 start_codon:yes stop_codon:yes gene_type:complete